MNEGSKSWVANRVIKFFDEDEQDRREDRERRLQRYAKFRQWTEGKTWPWEGASDCAVPDITTDVLRTEDTLHNAVMSTRPAVVSEAIRKDNEDKQRTIDALLDAQFFIDQPGEKVVEEMTDTFVMDGVTTVFVPWIEETRKVSERRVFPAIPFETLPTEHFEQILAETHPDSDRSRMGDESAKDYGWDWIVSQDGEDKTVKFYTEDDEVVMIVQGEVTVFDGPRTLVKEYEEVFHPVRCANLQPPSPSNPGGAPHVILVDYPSVDEILDLQRKDFYDLVSKKDVENLENVSRDTTREAAKKQTDAFQGKHDERRPSEPMHGTLTRLTCFDVYDADGDGIAEDVVWWVILETKQLLRARLMTEVYPFKRPRRPFAEGNFLPVKGRREGISLPELMEGLHDVMKETLDQSIDNGTLTNSPFFFYRPTSNLKPEVIRPWPGDGIPINDPKNDVFFPNMQNNSQAWAMNMLAFLTQQKERLTLQGDLQSGRVPAGKASALRTVGGIERIQAMGEARPERILRRFFMMLTDVFRMMHELNRKFLPDGKQYRIAGVVAKNDDPYGQIEKASEIDIDAEFDFSANFQNSSKTALQQSLMSVAGVVISPLTMQLGIVGPDEVFRLVRDIVNAFGQGTNSGYVSEPTPGAGQPRILAEEALTQIINLQIPEGLPAEAGGPREHLQRLIELIRDEGWQATAENIPQHVPILEQYMKNIRDLVAQQQQQEQLAQAAQQFGGQPGQPGRPPEAPIDTSTSPLQQNELSDESLPGAQGILA
jgi:hypothetical protein